MLLHEIHLEEGLTEESDEGMCPMPPVATILYILKVSNNYKICNSILVDRFTRLSRLYKLSNLMEMLYIFIADDNPVLYHARDHLTKCVND